MTELLVSDIAPVVYSFLSGCIVAFSISLYRYKRWVKRGDIVEINERK